MECSMVPRMQPDRAVGQVPQVCAASTGGRAAEGLKWSVVDGCSGVAVHINGVSQAVVTPDAGQLVRH